MLEDLKHRVFESNLDLINRGLALFTWGSASEIDRSLNLVVIKPSGIPYENMTAKDMVIVDLEGHIIEGKIKPCSDTATHLELYKAFSELGGIVHIRSTYATAWAQAGVGIPNIGTTHADYFGEAIPCTRDMKKEEVMGEYEKEIGTVIIERFQDIDPMYVPGVLVKNHAPFCWGRDLDEAVDHAEIMEQVAKMAYLSYQINPALTMNPLLLKRHFPYE